MTKKLYLVDGSGFIFRAFFALPPLTRPDGVPVGAVYGFCNMLLRLRDDIAADSSLAVMFDTKHATFRHDIYPEYKANRVEPPEDLVPQFGLIRQACAAFNVPSIELDGFEADDLIATYAREAHSMGYEVIIVSSDKDLMQLINDAISMLDPIKYNKISYAEVEKKFGVRPEKVVDVQALAGDSTDNVPGIPGIGIKTAAELINTFGSLEDLLANAHTIKQPKRRQRLQEHAEDARVSKQLVQLDEKAPINQHIPDFVLTDPDPLELNEFLRQQGFNSLVARLEKMFGTTENKSEKQYQTILTEQALKEAITACKQSMIMSIDCETNSLDAQQAKLVGICLAAAPGQAWYLPLAHQVSEQQLPLDLVRQALQPILDDPTVLKIGHNFKYDWQILAHNDIHVSPVNDTMLLSYCLDAGKGGHGMDELSEKHLAHISIKYKDVVGSGKKQLTFDQVELDKATEYAAEDADITLQLHQKLFPRLAQERVVSVYEHIERPLIGVIARMESNGIKVCKDKLNQLGQEFTTRMVVLEQQIYQAAGREFNISSPKQLGEILFNEMGLEPYKKTKTGAYVTDADTLTKLAAQGHDLPKLVIDWRGLAKLNSTYVEGLTNAINPDTGRIHTSFVMTGAATGRLSSTDPNLQNIPIRNEDGRKIREAFVPEEGYSLMSLDYSQVELRLLAHVGKIDKLAEAFRQGLDIHAATAMEIFDLTPETLTPEHRRRAKAINFGIIYGISAHGLSEQLDIPRSEAGAYIKLYLERYPGILDYMEQYKEFARENGFVQSLFGRKCHVPGIKDKNFAIRGFAERQAINAPLQGTTADIAKKAMVRVDKMIQDEQLDARLLLQVHDELLFEVRTDKQQQLAKKFKSAMENVVRLDVPLVVDVGVGYNWNEAH